MPQENMRNMLFLSVLAILFFIGLNHTAFFSHEQLFGIDRCLWGSGLAVVWCVCECLGARLRVWMRHTVLFYSLAFLNYLYVKHPLLEVALLCVAIVSFLVLLLDIKTLVLLFVLSEILGVGFAWVAHTKSLPDSFLTVLALKSVMIWIGGSMRHRMLQTEESKRKTIALLGSSIAHELRTPFLGLRAGAQGLQQYLPDLIAGYQQAAEAGLSVPAIREAHLHSLKHFSQHIQKEVEGAHTILEILLMNAGKHHIETDTFTTCSMQACLQEALERYPYHEQASKELIHLQTSDDFSFWGNQILMVHVLFNLLRNAFYFIARARKGHIEIGSTHTDSEYSLWVKDTAVGIPADVLPHIFERFYTTTGSGTGVGLSFCQLVMESMQGRIHCESQEGVFTTFVLTFPRPQ